MAVRRNRIDRKVNLMLDGDRVVDMPPSWAFTIDCPHHGKIHLNFNPYRENGREDIAGHVRDAFWSLRHELVGMSLQYQEHGMRIFWRFLDYLYSTAGESITCLAQVDRNLLDRYLAWMELQVTGRGKNKGKPWSVAMKKRAFDYLKSTLINRQKRAPASVSPDLTFPRNPFPNSNHLTPRRESFSVAEQMRITEALNSDLRCIHECGGYYGNGKKLPTAQVLVVHLMLLAMATGRNFQPLLELQRDSLRAHPLTDRELLVTTKRRGWATHVTSMRKSAPIDQGGISTIPCSIGDHFRFLCDFTAPLVGEAAERDHNFVFLHRVTKYQRKGQIERLDPDVTKAAVKAFIRRHNLLDDRGILLALSIARLRPTFGTELYRRTRDIRRVQQALGHASPETTARHYATAPLEEERDHDMVLDGMVSHYTRIEIDGKILLAADGKIPLQDMKDLLSGGYNTGIARCKNPFRENETVCLKFVHCFKCPSMCVFEDDLWRLFSFYYRLLAEQTKINPSHWLKTYGPIIRRIDTDIASQFPANKVEASKRKAQENPHPTWRTPLL